MRAPGHAPAPAAGAMISGLHPLVEARGLTKRYPGVVALSEVDFTLEAGEVHVLFGENGAGKSTLISILAGVTAPTAGTIAINGEPVTIFTVRHALAVGISAVYQEFSLVPTQTVLENLVLGDEPSSGPFLKRGEGRRRAKGLFDALDCDIDLDRSVSRLSRGEQQIVEIAKAMRGDMRVLILDEPTASLTDRETGILFGLIHRLKARGVGIVYISHRIHEFERIADRITVLRDGRHCGTVPAKGMSRGAPHRHDDGTGRSARSIPPSHARGDRRFCASTASSQKESRARTSRSEPGR